MRRPLLESIARKYWPALAELDSTRRRLLAAQLTLVISLAPLAAAGLLLLVQQTDLALLMRI